MICSSKTDFKTMAPAAGFYTTPGAGRNEVRIAYVLKKEDLVRALFVSLQRLAFHF